MHATTRDTTQQWVERWLASGRPHACAYPIQAVDRTWTSNGHNQYTQIAGTNGGALTGDLNGTLTFDGSSTFVYDTDRLIAEYNSSGAVQRRYVHGAGVDEPMVWYEASTVSSTTRRYLHAGHQGCKQALKFDQDLGLTGVEE